MTSLTKAARDARLQSVTFAVENPGIQAALIIVLTKNTEFLMALINYLSRSGPPAGDVIALLTALADDPQVGQMARAYLADWSKS